MSSLTAAVTLPPPFGSLTDGTLPSLGLNDAQARGSFYVLEDFGQASNGGYQTNVVSGSNNYSGGGRGGIVIPNSELAQHPGVAFATTVNTGYAGVGAMSQGMPVWGASGVSVTWQVCFRSPTVVSTATDTYTFFVGGQGVTPAAYAGDGPCFAYTHSANGGNWQVCTCNPANQLPVYTPTTVPFVPATWHNIRIQLTGTTWQFSMDNQIVATTTDPSFNAGNIFLASAGAMQLVRSAAAASSPPSISALIDRGSVYATGLQR